LAEHSKIPGIIKRIRAS